MALPFGLKQNIQEIFLKNNMIIANNLVKMIDNRKIIDSVSLTLDFSQITVLIGPSGSGKTTLIKLLSCLEKPTSGEIIFEGNVISNKNYKMADMLYPKINVVFQNLFLWPHLTNRQNILLSLRDKSDKKEDLFDELVGTFLLTEFLDKYPNQCSVGQRQRIALARALILEPKYLFLDEITSALDIEHTGIILKYLKKLRDGGTSILLVTHFLMFAQKAADHIIFLESGRIRDEGNNDILTFPSSERLQNFLGGIKGIVVEDKIPLETLLYNFRNGNDRYTKLRIVYRILDHDVNDEIIEDIFTYILKNYSFFIDDYRKWINVKGDDSDWSKIYNHLSERILAYKYPPTKLWIYILAFKMYSNYFEKENEINNLMSKFSNTNWDQKALEYLFN